MEIRIPKNAPLVPHNKRWRFCVGSGHALLALRTDYTRQLKFIHDELGIQRVRFHGIFCDDMRTFTDLSALMPIPGGEAFEEYNFNACGVAYDNVLAAGMKPLVELSFMPEKLARVREGEEKRGSFFYRPVIVPPEDYDKWADYIKAFVRFLIHRYGAEEVRSWLFEVWNEPDLPGAFWNGTRDEYFRLYETTARAIKEIDPDIKVGGPATSNSKWVASFVDYCEKRQAPVDFVTTHQYAGDPLGGVESQGDDDQEGFDIESLMASMGEAVKTLLRTEDKSLLNAFRTIMPDKTESTDIVYGLFPGNAKKVKLQAKGLPVYYTEWNECAIFSAATNDTRKVAAYDVRAALETDGSLDGSSIWCFSDIFEELHPYPQEFHGGFGILTQNGIPKPVYHALKMLSDAGDMRLDLGEEATKGEIGYAAFKKGASTQIILFRQKMKNLDLPVERVEVSVELDSEPVKVCQRRIDENSGNPLKIWKEMGSPMSLNKAEIDLITEKSAAEDAPCGFGYNDGVLKLHTELGVNDVVFLTIE